MKKILLPLAALSITGCMLQGSANSNALLDDDWIAFEGIISNDDNDYELVQGTVFSDSDEDSSEEDIALPLAHENPQANRALLRAIKEDDPHLARKAIERGADPNAAVYHWEQAGQLPTPLLHIAIAHASLDVVKTMIGYGADINRLNYNRQTPLQVAYTELSRSEANRDFANAERLNAIIAYLESLGARRFQSQAYPRAGIKYRGQ